MTEASTRVLDRLYASVWGVGGNWKDDFISLDESLPGALLNYADELELTPKEIHGALDLWRAMMLEAVEEAADRYRTRLLHRIEIPDEMWDWAGAEAKTTGDGPATFLRNVLIEEVLRLQAVKSSKPKGKDEAQGPEDA